MEKLIQDILKQASLSGEQQARIVEFLVSDPQMVYQEIAKFLAPKINAKEIDIYDFLMTHDKQIYNDNNLNKIQ